MNHSIENACERSYLAWKSFKKSSYATRRKLLETIATEIENLGDQLIQVAMKETNLPEARLTGERGRTCNQLRVYGKNVTDGQWANAHIDTAVPDRKPIPKADIRKINQSIGPVVVFGASNFPFAYSTAGGDTASALAAGSTVLLKAHPAHPETSAMVAQAISKALSVMNLSQDIFIHIDESDFSAGKALVQNPKVKGVGFTGSYSGGMALVKYASERDEPIPVFAEMGSINPVLIMHQEFDESLKEKINQLAGAITLGVGQFCTNPGLILIKDGPMLEQVSKHLAEAISKAGIGKMLHPGIEKSYLENSKKALSQKGVELISKSYDGEAAGMAMLAQTSSEVFEGNPQLHQEVFGPYSMMVVCKDEQDILDTYALIEGQLTSSLFIEDDAHELMSRCFDVMDEKAGRIILNGVPTGVEVCHSMVHGGPFPSTTDSRFTSVGQDAIMRWVRPVCFQSVVDGALPEGLRNANPLGIPRFVNGIWSKDSV